MSFLNKSSKSISTIHACINSVSSQALSVNDEYLFTSEDLLGRRFQRLELLV